MTKMCLLNFVLSDLIVFDPRVIILYPNLKVAIKGVHQLSVHLFCMEQGDERVQDIES